VVRGKGEELKLVSKRRRGGGLRGCPVMET